jgi:hypothetical protein
MPAIEKGMGAVLLNVIEENTLLCMFASQGQLSEKEARWSRGRDAPAEEEPGLDGALPS